MRKALFTRLLSAAPHGEAATAHQEPPKLDAAPLISGLNLKPTTESTFQRGQEPPRRLLRYEGAAGDDVVGRFRVRLLVVMGPEPEAGGLPVGEWTLFMDNAAPNRTQQTRKLRRQILRKWSEANQWPGDLAARVAHHFGQAERLAFHVAQDPRLASLGIAVMSSATDTFITVADRP